MNILQAISDPNLFRPYLAGTPDGDLSSWSHWMTFLKVLYGLELDPSEFDLVRQCTGRDPARLPSEGFSECLVLCGRRSGKSKVTALIGAAEAILGDKHQLSAGEIPMVPILSPTRNQSRIIHSYLRSIFDSTRLLEGEVADERRDSFSLRDGTEISILTGDPRAVRGFSAVALIVDEITMFGLSEESKVRNDTELVRSIRPSLASTGGRLVCVGTPYAAKGYGYSTWRAAYGNDESDILCWNAASLAMNPTLSEAVVNRAIAEDPTAARCEYATEPGLFREDVDSFVHRSVCESLVFRGRKELPPQHGITYGAFADVSGGRHDDAALAIAHKEGRTVVLDLLHRYRSPHNPYTVVREMARTLRHYALDRCLGDAYSAEWCRGAFQSCGIRYERATTSAWKTGVAATKKVAKSKSDLYASLLPRLHSGEVELLDDDVLITQLSSLQRRTRSGGKDIIDHPPGAKDDAANVLAGVADAVEQKRHRAGSIKVGVIGDDRPRGRFIDQYHREMTTIVPGMTMKVQR